MESMAASCCFLTFIETLLFHSKNYIMKKIWLLAIASSLTLASMATPLKHGKHKSCKNCTQKVCTPVCKEKAGCAKMSCNQS